MGSIFFLAAVAAVIGGIWVRSLLKQRDDVIQEYERNISSLNNALAQLTHENIPKEQPGSSALLRAKASLQASKQMCFTLAKREAQSLETAKKAEQDRKQQEIFNREVLSRIREESALLPYVVEWMDKIQKVWDARNSAYLLKKKNPAPKAHEAVKEANAEARNWKRRAQILSNQLALYEAQIPWLPETVEYTVQETLEGLQFLESEELERNAGQEPERTYIPPVEWKRLNKKQRSQIALDRYFEKRHKSPWLAGIAYERFIGHLYEKQGFFVTYHGARYGKEDMGIDLICKKDEKYVLIQCKRLSEVRGTPVRENTVAQIYGAALFYAYKNNIPAGNVIPKIVTSYKLSDTAKHFAQALNVEIQEYIPLSRYPSIKCNIGSEGERIYHLPFDQQYDITQIDLNKGERWAETIEEAENLGFRRAMRWLGN